jgi:hypothetical protein
LILRATSVEALRIRLAIQFLSFLRAAREANREHRCTANAAALKTARLSVVVWRRREEVAVYQHLALTQLPPAHRRQQSNFVSDNNTTLQHRVIAKFSRLLKFTNFASMILLVVRQG